MSQTIEIIEETKGWIAVNKPSGLSVHNAEDQTNLLLILEEHLGCTLHAAHRLDSPTSGVLLLGKAPQSTHLLQQALQSATKEYTAVLRGQITPAEGTWNWSLTNKSEGFRNPRGRASERVKARTRYQTIQFNQYLTMVKVHLDTGRQHQIRKHALLAKHPVVGDTRYGDKRYNRSIQRRYGIDQLCLCANRLDVVLEGQPYSFEAPLPPSWSKFFASS